jgi:hypothetical protein
MQGLRVDISEALQLVACWLSTRIRDRSTIEAISISEGTPRAA